MRVVVACALVLLCLFLAQVEARPKFRYESDDEDNEDGSDEEHDRNFLPESISNLVRSLYTSLVEAAAKARHSDDSMITEITHERSSSVSHEQQQPCAVQSGQQLQIQQQQQPVVVVQQQPAQSTAVLPQPGTSGTGRSVEVSGVQPLPAATPVAVQPVAPVQQPTVEVQPQPAVQPEVQSQPRAAAPTTVPAAPQPQPAVQLPATPTLDAVANALLQALPQATATANVNALLTTLGQQRPTTQNIDVQNTIISQSPSSYSTSSVTFNAPAGGGIPGTGRSALPEGAGTVQPAPTVVNLSPVTVMDIAKLLEGGNKASGDSAVFAAEAVKLGGSPDAAWMLGGPALVKRFLALEHLVISMRLLRRGLCQLASSPELYSHLRWRLISSHAAMSAAHYVLGIGDRHPHNFLIDLSSGDLIGIDFGYAFGVTVVALPTPEYVPIRLTASLRELLEPSGPAGHFGVTLTQALSALRSSSNLFFSILKTFIADDSTADWSAYAQQVGQTGKTLQASRLTLAHNKLLGHCPVQLLIEDCALRFASRPWFADCANTLRKTAGVTTAEALSGAQLVPAQLLTPAEQTRRLICLSTCPELLSRMHPGWNASL
ncbi:hypothetical protein AAHC03_017167 [Spirometra sp. Aus1]